MAIITIEYNDQNPDDRWALKRAIKSADMALVLFQVTRNLQKSMYNDKSSDEYVEGIHDTIHNINELMEDHGIFLDDLIE